jgi:uncharacterized protein
MTPRLTLLTILCAWSLLTCAQQNAAHINSGEIIENGVKLYDSGKYKDALRELDKVPAGDTNYVRALYECALTCSRDSQFARGIEYCEKGLADRSDAGREPELLVLYGSLLDYNNEQDRALHVFDSALLVYPAYRNLYIGKGTTLIRMKKYMEAEKMLQQAALISPYSASLHHKLGLAALNQGKVVPAFLCMLASLTIDPVSTNYKDAINILSEISKSTDHITEMLDKRTGEPSDNFRLVEQIVLSKIALDKNYKIIISLDDKISRQAQVLLEKLVFDESDQDFYMQYYVPVFKKIFEDKKFEYFVNYIFSNVDLPAIQDFNKKKKKEIETLKTDLVGYFNLLRATRELQYAKRNTSGPRYHFDDGKLYGKGVIEGKDILTGPWTFYFSFGNKKAEGIFNDKGEKNSAFSYYFFNGQLKAQEIYRNGKQEGVETYYFEQGGVASRATYKNGQPDGQHTSYYENGVVKNIAHYNNGQLNGVKKTFYNAGPLQMEENFVNGKRQGPVKTYYINGRPETEGIYANDELHGNFRGWNSEGILNAEGSYMQGKLFGTVKRYDDNGKLQTVETYDNKGLLTEYVSYHENGKLAYSFKNKNGKTTGDINYYDVDGKLYSTLTYDEDKLKSGRYFDKNGKQISFSESKNGKLDMISFNPDGTKQAFSPYNENGVLTGTKVNYFGSGKEKLVEAYSDGSLNGETVGYHPSGKKSYEVHNTEGVKTGYYTSWYPHGGLQEEGWYGEDKLQGEWLSYNKFGSLTSRSWYVNGARNGLKTDYWPNGKMQTVYRIETDKFSTMTEYDTAGQVINIVKLNNGNGKYTSRYPNGKLHSECDYVNGDMEGPSIFYFPDGSKQAISHYKHGVLDSNYVAYNYGGKVRAEGRYKLNEKEGAWKYYTPQGILYCTEDYKSGKLVKTSFYFKNGKTDTEFESRNNQRHGLYKRYAEDGSLMYQIRYDNGLQIGYSYLDKKGQLIPEIAFIQGNGKLQAFYQNGNPSADMQFVDGVLHGAYTLYHPNGNTWVTENLYYDDREGPKTENFSDGKLNTVYTYKHDNLHGPYKEYNAKGVVIEEGNFYDDGLHGEQRFYDDSGKLKQVRIYYYGLLLEVK